MCHKNIKIISSIKEGSLIKCECGSYTFKFNNIIFEFTENELKSFKKYLMKINVITGKISAYVIFQLVGKFLLLQVKVIYF